MAQGQAEAAWICPRTPDTTRSERPKKHAWNTNIQVQKRWIFLSLNCSNQIRYTTFRRRSVLEKNVSHNFWICFNRRIFTVLDCALNHVQLPTDVASKTFGSIIALESYHIKSRRQCHLNSGSSTNSEKSVDSHIWAKMYFQTKQKHPAWEGETSEMIKGVK